MNSLDLRLHQAIRQQRQGNLAAAQRKCRSILKKAPNHPETLQLLAIIMQQSGNSQSARHLMQKALSASPENPDLLKNLAEIHRAEGDLVQAQQYARKALLIAPEHVDALFVSGALYLEQGDHVRAMDQFSRLVALNPDDVEAQNEYANLLCARGQIDEAINRYRHAIYCQPDYIDCRINLGDSLLQVDDFESAIEQYQYALGIQPQNARLHSQLGRAFALQHDPDRAMSCFELALEQDPLLLEARINIGKLIFDSDPHQAENWFKSVLDIDPGYAEGYYWMGILFQSLGKFDRAANYLQQAIRLNPEFAQAWFRMSMDRSFQPSDTQLQNLEEQFTLKVAAGLDDEQQVILGFTLGRFHEKVHNHATSFRYFQHANRIKSARRPFDAATHNAQIDNIIEIFNAEFFQKRARWGNQSEAPLFIIGMPRSGTTLVEQIIAGNPEVHAAGELRTMLELSTSVKSTSATGRRSQARYFAELKQDEVDKLAQQQLRQMLKLDPQARRIIDKLPGNYFRLGLIRMLFPRATIVHCQRDAMDSCWSCYQQNFEEGLHFTYDLENLGQAYRGYQHLMAHWHNIFPGQIHDISYEQLVLEPEETSRRLFQHCGLEWSPQVLEFNAQAASVATASLWQVRQPLYQSSIGRWKDYQPYLQLLEHSLSNDLIHPV